MQIFLQAESEKRGGCTLLFWVKNWDERKKGERVSTDNLGKEETWDCLVSNKNKTEPCSKKGCRGGVDDNLRERESGKMVAREKSKGIPK